jgi:hypothetical protein
MYCFRDLLDYLTNEQVNLRAKRSERSSFFIISIT